MSDTSFEVLGMPTIFSFTKPHREGNAIDFG